MAHSILIHRKALGASTGSLEAQNPEFLRIASGKSLFDNADDTGLGEEGDITIDDLSVPPELAGTGKYSTAYAAIQDDAFWAQLDQFVKFNWLVTTTIPALGADSATLSDATIAVLHANDAIASLTENAFPDLLIGCQLDSKGLGRSL
jgi:hypothetical protein